MSSAPIGVVTNPRSGGRRRVHSAEALAYILGEQGEMVAPGDLEALAAHARLFRERGIETLCIDGGDGTIHRVLTAMVRVYGEADLPPVAILRGGTMNNAAASIGQDVAASRMLRAVVDARASARPLPHTVRRLMRIESADRDPSYGFLVGAGLVARFLELYDARRAPSTLLAATLLGRAVISAVVRGSFARALDRPFTGAVSLDGRQLSGDTFTAVAMGTIEQVGFGFRAFQSIATEPDRLQLVTIRGSPGRLAWELPGLYAGRGVRRRGNTSAGGSEVVLRSAAPFPYVVDGDPYRADPPELRIAVGPRVAFLTAG